MKPSRCLTKKQATDWFVFTSIYVCVREREKERERKREGVHVSLD